MLPEYYEAQRRIKEKRGAAIMGFIFALLALAGVVWLFTPANTCAVFTFMDWNKPGPADDLPFCWTPLQGVVR